MTGEAIVTNGKHLNYKEKALEGFLSVLMVLVFAVIFIVMSCLKSI